MKNKRLALNALTSLAALALCGCTTRLIDFTVISSKNIEWSRANEYRRGTSRVSGEDTKQVIIIIPTGVPNAKQALDRAIESIPGAVALVDGVLTHKFSYLPYIYGQRSYIVEGTPLIDEKHASTSLSEPYYIVEINIDGFVKKTRVVSSAEFREAKSKLFRENKSV